MARVRNQRVRSQGIYVEGLDEFRRGLRQAGPEATEALKEANWRVAQRVVDAADRRAQSVSRQAALAATSMRAARRQSGADVRIGSASIPFALGAEFGARNYPQFMEWRGASTGAGYFLWPTIRSLRDEIAATYLDDLIAAVTPAFPDTNPLA